jgi:hypothetical protein
MLSLGELEGERWRSGHAVDENNVAVGINDGNRDRCAFRPLNVGLMGMICPRNAASLCVVFSQDRL